MRMVPNHGNTLIITTVFTIAGIFLNALESILLDVFQSMKQVRPIELLVAGGGCRNLAMFDQLVRR